MKRAGRMLGCRTAWGKLLGPLSRWAFSVYVCTYIGFLILFLFSQKDLDFEISFTGTTDVQRLSSAEIQQLKKPDRWHGYIGQLKISGSSTEASWIDYRQRRERPREDQPRTKLFDTWPLKIERSNDYQPGSTRYFTSPSQFVAAVGALPIVLVVIRRATGRSRQREMRPSWSAALMVRHLYLTALFTVLALVLAITLFPLRADLSSSVSNASWPATVGCELRGQLAKSTLSLWRYHGFGRFEITRPTVIVDSWFLHIEDPQVTGYDQWNASSPTYLLIALACIPLMIWGLLAVRRRQGAVDSFCAACGYDLTGNVSGTCPECGRAIVSKAAPKKATA